MTRPAFIERNGKIYIRRHVYSPEVQGGWKEGEEEVKIILRAEPFLVLLFPDDHERLYHHYIIYGPCSSENFQASSENFFDDGGRKLERYHSIGGFRNENNMRLSVKAMQKTWKMASEEVKGKVVKLVSDL